MNIDGLSEMTLEKLIDAGFLRELPDVFFLDRYQADIVKMEGFGEKSYQNLISSADKAKTTTAARLLYGLGIPNIGVANAKMIANHFQGDMNRIMRADKETLTDIEGVGEVMANAFCEYFANAHNQKIAEELLRFIRIEKEAAQNQTLSGISFVVTGTLTHYANRDALKASIDARGGKVTGSVSKKTNYLINNDLMSHSANNQIAKEKCNPILSEEMFIEMFGE